MGCSHSFVVGNRCPTEEAAALFGWELFVPSRGLGAQERLQLGISIHIVLLSEARRKGELQQHDRLILELRQRTVRLM